MIKKIIILVIAVVIIAISLSYHSVGTFLLRKYLKPVAYQTENVTAAVYAGWTQSAKFALPVAFHHQQYSLSCEIAALKMALDYYGVGASEDELIEQIPFEKVGGDPDKGFVGKIDGKMPLTGYGVYEDPIVKVARNYRPVKKISGVGLSDLIAEISAGHPVVVWGSVNNGYDISWQTPTGKVVKAVSGEHARVAVGWVGEASDPSYILIIDPVYGRIQLSQKAFLKDWGLLGNKAVVVY